MGRKRKGYCRFPAVSVSFTEVNPDKGTETVSTSPTGILANDTVYRS